MENYDPEQCEIELKERFDADMAIIKKAHEMFGDSIYDDAFRKTLRFLLEAWKEAQRIGFSFEDFQDFLHETVRDYNSLNKAS